MTEHDVAPQPGVRVESVRGEAFRALVRRARVYVVAPLREDFGIAQLEALADGCMLVTTDAPGPYEARELARELDPRLVGDDLARRAAHRARRPAARLRGARGGAARAVLARRRSTATVAEELLAAACSAHAARADVAPGGSVTCGGGRAVGQARRRAPASRSAGRRRPRPAARSRARRRPAAAGADLRRRLVERHREHARAP